MRRDKLLKYLMESERSTYAIFILIRVFSIVASLIILRITLDHFSLLDFSQVQRQYGLLSILLWLADFGLLNYAIILFSDNGARDLQKVLSTRFWSILILFSIYLTSHICMGHSLEFGFLICAIFFDIYTDSLNAFRQIAASAKFSIFSMVVKKFSQLMLILLALRIDQNLSLTDYALAFTFPSLLIFYFDAATFKFRFSSFQTKYLFDSKKIWFQSGGTSLASFDIPLLISLNALSVIPIFVVSRKISNALGVFGSTLVPHSMRDAASNRVSTRKTLNGVYSISFLVFGFCIPIGLFSELVITNFFNLESSRDNLYIFLVVLAAIPIGVITSNLNAVLISTNRAGLAARTTYASSLTYLATIYFGCILNQPYIGLSLAVVLNLLTEYSMQRYILRKDLKNE